jgi:hypothetical protein
MTSGWLTRWIVLIALAASMTGAAAFSQDEGDTAAPGEHTEQAEAETAPAPPRPMLLRQGSHLLRAVGEMSMDDERGAWTLTIEPKDERRPHQELTVLPCSLLDEMERLIEAAPGYELKFEVTGEVYVYKKRNYFMPTHPPLLVGRHEAGRPAEEPAGPAESEGDIEEGDEESSAETPKRDTADDIIRDLEDSAGLFAHRPDAGAQADAGDEAGVRPVREGAVLVSRRGHVRRTGGGAYIFIFDADAEGQADPPMVLLPCMLLERLEQYSWRAGDMAVVLMSGRVYTYHGLNYLLPTVYRIPYQRTPITP